jgi:hypothetical protein
MRVAVVGSVTFQDRDWLHAGLDLLNERAPISEIVEGGRPGADVRAQEWAYKRSVRCLTIPCQFERHGPHAELEQHTEIAKALPKVVLATPCANEDLLAIHRAFGHTVVRLEKMPVAKTPGR